MSLPTGSEDGSAFRGDARVGTGCPPSHLTCGGFRHSGPCYKTFVHMRLRQFATVVRCGPGPQQGRIPSTDLRENR